MTRVAHDPESKATAHPRAALARRYSALVGLAGLVIYGAVSITPWTPDLSDPADVTVSSTDKPAQESAERIVPAATTVAAPTPALPEIVPDPRPGDMRIDANADSLPLAYNPPAAAAVIDNIAYGPDPAQGIDLYLPAETDAPVIIFLHSGGWIGGDEDVVPDIAMRFVERGYAVASVGYRLAPENSFPAPVTDVKSAIYWLKAYGADEGTIDGDRIVLMGTSAGGHLAAFAGATPGEFEPEDLPADQAVFDSTVVGVVSVVGPTDLVQLYDQENPWARGLTTAFAGCYPCDAEQLLEPSIGPRVHADLPPAYWAYGMDDVLIDVNAQGIATAVAWSAAAGEGSSWIDIVEGADHNLTEALINMRALESFVDGVVGLG